MLHDFIISFPLRVCLRAWVSPMRSAVRTKDVVRSCSRYAFTMPIVYLAVCMLRCSDSDSMGLVWFGIITYYFPSSGYASPLQYTL